MAVVGSVSEAKVDVSFQWSIPDFFSHNIDQGEKIKSPSFLFSGRIWNLELYPRGKGIKTDGWISLFLEMQSSANGDRTVTLSIDLKKADSSFEKKRGPTTVTFTEVSHGWGWPEFLKQDDLKQRTSVSVHWNVLTVLCHIVTAEPHPVERILPPSKLVELETLSSNLKELFHSRKKTDAKLKVQEKEFEVHRAILMARSPVFSAMFEHEMKEGETGCVDIGDCDEETFGDFLEYLYTGEYECSSIENACRLYATCHKYDVKGLMSLCVSYMTRNLTVNTFCEVVSLVDRYDDSRLMSSVQTFFNKNSKTLFPADGWAKLMKEHSLLIKRLLVNMT